MDQTALVDKLMDQAHRALLAAENEKIGGLYQLYAKGINNLIDDLTRINAKFLDQEEPTFSDWKRLQLDQVSFRTIEQRMGLLKQSVIDQFNTDITQFYMDGYNRTAYMLDQATPSNVDIGYQAPPDVFISDYLNTPWKGARFSERLGVITDLMSRDIQGQLVMSMISGDSVSKMASRIRDFVGVPDDENLVTRPRASAQLYRATMIARTEMIRAARLAQQKIFDENDDIMDGKYWTTKPGFFKVCDECQDRDGLTPDEIDELDDDLEDDPPGHPNCRCFWAPKMKSWLSLLGPDLSKGMKDELPDPYSMMEPNEFGNLVSVKPQSYESWSNDYISPSGSVSIHAEAG